MRIAVVANDTRGGVQPYAALAAGLKAAGHDMICVAPLEFASLFASLHLPFSPLTIDAAQMRDATRVAERGIAQTLQFVANETPKHLAMWTKEALSACEGVDCITGGVGGMVVALGVADKLGVPFVETHLQPVSAPSLTYPGFLWPNPPAWLGDTGIKMSHMISDFGIWMPFKSAMAKVRKNVLKLEGLSRASVGQPKLYGFSPHVVPVEFKPPQKGEVTGYWNLPPKFNDTPPSGLEEFLQRPGPVISVGFGSMANDDPAQVSALVVEAARKAEVRMVLLSGWGGLADASDNDTMFTAQAVAHEWLFDRVDGAVHHGGAGTTGATFRAGIPTTVVSFSMDQPFWGSRVYELGCGPKPIPRKSLSADRLAEAMASMINSKSINERAKALGASISEEDGVGSAVKIFELIKKV